MKSLTKNCGRDESDYILSHAYGERFYQEFDRVFGLKPLQLRKCNPAEREVTILKPPVITYGFPSTSSPADDKYEGDLK